MRLNASNGTALMGVTFGISVDGVDVPGAAGDLPRWFDAANDVIVYQDLSAIPARIRTVTLPATFATLDTNGANELGGGGGVWVAYLTAAPGVRTSISGTGPYPNAGLCDVDEYGSFALVQNRAFGQGIVCFSDTGTQTAKWDVVLSLPSLMIRNSIIAYCDLEGVWHLRDVTTGATVPLANREGVLVTKMVPVTVGTTVYVIEELPDKLTFRPAATGAGFVIAPAPAFNPDVVALSSTEVRIGWSVGAGEAATELRLLDLVVKSGVTETGTAAGGGGVVFTPGTTLTAETFPVGPVIGGDDPGRDLLNMLRPDQPFVDVRGGKGYLTPPWHKTLAKRFALDAEAIDLSSQTTGTLPPEQGGGPGTALIAENLIGTVPQAAKWREVTTTLTGTQDDLAYDDADFLRAANAAPLTLTGLLAGVPGQRLVVVATETDSVTFLHQSASSAAANRILSYTGADVTITEDTAALLEYDGAEDRWRLLFVVGSAAVEDAGSWSPLVSTPTPLNLHDVVAGAGYWSPLTNGIVAAPELVFWLADTITVWTSLDASGPIIPNITADSDGDCIAVFTPAP